jgi:thiamine kinase-like enzyme
MNSLHSHIDVSSVVSQFAIAGEVQSTAPICVGHINDTFLVHTSGEENPDYVIQRINHEIFKDVDKLMENISRVISHITSKLADQHESGAPEFLELIQSKSRKLYYQDHSGGYWRCYVYCRNQSAGFNKITPKMALEGGHVLGRFQRLLSDLHGGPLHDTIPDFHNIEKRYRDFKLAYNSDRLNRAQFVAAETNIFESRIDEMSEIHRLGKQGLLPVRTTHNDTKFNNILFDENAKALCIIDLDTVMNGYIHYDFGDAVRTLANTANEDETDHSKIKFDFELYKQFAQGYLQEALQFLTEGELKHLAFSAKMMTFMIAMRFLTDYLEGDIYYKTNYESHNLDRAKNQLQLLQQMEHHFDKMEEVIRRYP